ncbi:hypothetical protein [Stigmatella aurantiaca]|uniref:Conserved uncharacterized protein n=1 Tax=Stigmatella aurantiaca (strain DW4/3-1) TaxID=378806 RepID=Q093X2_STIAD|nr:hypothetical protein [Stigmatella aurantiaca]ADO69762.1 conserved uncharacterized protein [Stigmatella aurantiaca DW4/3-1]EAU67016.1 hypothetical protein STIAU_3508 [Stigmatella aurantiaca DW4/3-1]
MRRFLLGLLVANLLGFSPLSFMSPEAWAQRSRTKSTKSRAAKKATPKASPRLDSKPLESAPAASPSAGEAANASAAAPSRGPARIDFDDRLIQGQTNKSGAVYLYDRKELKTRSMIRERESFRSETLSTVYDP